MADDYCGSLCPFRGCPGCTHQPEPIEGQGDLLEELDHE